MSLSCTNRFVNNALVTVIDINVKGYTMCTLVYSVQSVKSMCLILFIALLKLSIYCADLSVSLCLHIDFTKIAPVVHLLRLPAHRLLTVTYSLRQVSLPQGSLAQLPGPGRLLTGTEHLQLWTDSWE